jgi:hypothetical protein
MEKGMDITNTNKTNFDIDKKNSKGQWPQFKENYYNDKGAEYDSILKLIEHERLENFINYIR